MADELGAVLEAPEVIADDVVKQPGEVQQEVTEDTKVEEVKGDERVMPQWIRNLKNTDPAAFKDAKATFFGKRTLDEKLKDFDLDGVRGWLEEKGGREALESSFTELQGKAQELEDISAKLLNDPAALVDDILAVVPESISRLAEATNAQWAKADPAGWGHAMTGILAATLVQENDLGESVSSVIKDIGTALKYGDTEGVKVAAAKLQQWTNSMITTARSAAPRTQPQPKGDGKPSVKEERETWEQERFNDDMERSVDSFRDPLIAKELDSFFKRRPNDNDAKELAASTVKTQVVARLNGDKKFQESLNALWGRRDKEGALRLIKSRETLAIQEIAPKVGRTIFGNPGPVKVEAEKPVTPRATTPRTTGRVDPSDAIFARILGR